MNTISNSRMNVGTPSSPSSSSPSCTSLSRALSVAWGGLALALVATAQTPPAPAPVPVTGRVPSSGTPAPKPAADAPKPAPTPAPAAQDPAAAAAKQREKDLLLQAFKGLEEELKASLPAYTQELQELSRAGIPREQWPLGPAARFYDRFEALAQQDQADALRWCIGAVSSTGKPIDEQISRKDLLYKRYVATCLDSTWTPDIVTFLKNENTPSGIGLERILPLLDGIGSRAPFVEYRTQALWAKQELCLKSTDPAHKAAGRGALETLATTFANTKQGREAKGVLFQMDKLQVGMPAPEVNTIDTDGKPFKLSDFRGKITVVSFWGFWCQPCRQAIPAERDMVKRLEGKPFAFVGVNTDQKKEDFVKLAAENGVNWRNSWQGSTTGPWCTDWGVQRFPTTYVLDEQGIIRAVNPQGQVLGNTVDHLIAELEKKNAGGGTPPAKDPAPTPK